MTGTVLRLTDVVKTFPGVRALDGVQLEVRAGEVHCLLGQNGAGKSTLIKVLAGVHQLDGGEITWLGEPFAPATPQAAMRAGIATIYQELDLVDDLSVAENAFLGHEQSRFGFTRRRAIADRTGAILARLGHPEIPARRLVRTLPAAGKQIVSMARALSHEARLIVMDEPSAVLAHDEVANLFRIIRELTAQDIAVIYISHRLAEIREIGDRVTVLKDGRTTAAGLPARTTETRELVGKMTGRSIEYVFPPRRDKSVKSGSGVAVAERGGPAGAGGLAASGAVGRADGTAGIGEVPGGGLEAESSAEHGPSVEGSDGAAGRGIAGRSDGAAGRGIAGRSDGGGRPGAMAGSDGVGPGGVAESGAVAELDGVARRDGARRPVGAAGPDTVAGSSGVVGRAGVGSGRGVADGGGRPLLVVEGLTRAGEFVDVSLSVGVGEIVGIAGLVGSGRSELLETIFGARRADSGTVTLSGHRVGGVGAAVRRGMGMAPEERKSQALLLDEPVYKNMTLASFAGFARGGFTDAKRERAAALRTAGSLELRPRDVDRPVRTLSGGNQQKVVVGRWLLGDTRLLLLDEPTRGVDVGARAELYQVIHDLAAGGVGVLLVSSEVPEVLGLADRVLVMREGRLIHEAPADELAEDTVLDLVMAGSLLEGESA